MLVVHHRSTLPERCPICNAPASRAMTLHFGTRYMDHSYVTVHVFLCREHADRYRAVRRAAESLVLGGLVGLVLAFMFRLHVAVPFLCFMAILFGTILFLGVISGHLQLGLRGRRYDVGGRAAWISGMCPEFLATFPPHTPGRD